MVYITNSFKNYNAATEQSANRIGTLISQARKVRGLTLESFSELLSGYGVCVKKQAIGKWERGESIPNGYQLLAVCHALDIENGVLFFSGGRESGELNDIGMKKLRDYREDLIASGRYSPAHATVQYIDMPVSHLRASAGTGSFLDDGGFDTVSVPAASVPEGSSFGIYVSGDSMEPRYHDGDIAWVRECSELAVGEIGIFICGGDGYIKKYGVREPDESVRDSFTDISGTVHMQPVLISLNKKYPPRPVFPDEGLRIVGRVLN